MASSGLAGRGQIGDWSGCAPSASARSSASSTTAAGRDTPTSATPPSPRASRRSPGAVAARYPWVEDYTPVNEPLTTARFSGLYGHWYPHGKDDRTFVRTLLNECKAVALAMRAIRAVNPAARLIQTEDLGKTYSTPKLAYQAEFENDRRWMTFDLLCGRIDAHHPLRWYLRRAGATAAELDWFRENPCPPDVIGTNYYITSQRSIDERLDRYPEWTHGGNERHAYADVEAIRVVAGEVANPRDLLREAWERYGLPLAITEAHLGDVPEEQIRWMNDVWQAAQGASRDGIDIRAVTAWSLLGAFDWHTLVTREENYYEPGVFDVRGRGITPTPLAAMVRALANGQDYYDPALTEPGWWRRPERLLYPPVDVSAAPVTSVHAAH